VYTAVHEQVPGAQTGASNKLVTAEPTSQTPGVFASGRTNSTALSASVAGPTGQRIGQAEAADEAGTLLPVPSEAILLLPPCLPAAARPRAGTVGADAASMRGAEAEALD